MIIAHRREKKMKKREPPFIEIVRLLKGYDLNCVSLSKVLGCCKTTASLKLKEPDRITLADLRQICRSGCVPAEEIRAAIKF